MITQSQQAALIALEQVRDHILFSGLSAKDLSELRVVLSLIATEINEHTSNNSLCPGSDQ